jgi:hypothetical protein
MTSNAVRSLRSLALLVGLGALALPATANATVVWTSGFETGSIAPDWMPSVNAGGSNVVVQEEHVYTGKYACEITVHPTDLFNGQDRVDIKHQSTLTDEGKDMWLSGHYMMLADPGVRNEFNFWESNVSFQNIIDFWVEPKTGGGTTIGFGVGPLGATPPNGPTSKSAGKLCRYDLSRRLRRVRCARRCRYRAANRVRTGWRCRWRRSRGGRWGRSGWWRVERPRKYG